MSSGSVGYAGESGAARVVGRWPGTLPGSSRCQELRDIASTPCFLAFLAAYRPNSISRVFSGCSVKPYFSNRLGKTASTFFCVLLVLEAQDGIISKADLVGLPF